MTVNLNSPSFRGFVCCLQLSRYRGDLLRAAEPLSYYTGVFGTPLSVSPLSDEARQLAFSATIFHWGLSAWSVYAIIGLSLAFFITTGSYHLVSLNFLPLIWRKIWGWRGDLIDTTAVLATLLVWQHH
ncbi:MAG: hypothetical protein CM15mP86_00580 [Gammaproteobacteria bacterium]|nr:MAG: hypothetical protein CM15mP86_00580 [Gammaproteobacteria bacterium]